jgi:hypothetical protein
MITLIFLITISASQPEQIVIDDDVQQVTATVRGPNIKHVVMTDKTTGWTMTGKETCGVVTYTTSDGKTIKGPVKKQGVSIKRRREI